MCEKLNCLPRQGGLLDQDILWVYRMQIVFKIQREKEEADQERIRKEAKH